MGMKPKLKSPKPWDFEELREALRDAWDQGIRGEEIQWEGPELTSHELLACCPGVADLLSSRWLEWEEEEHGKVLIDVILECALRLGIEQGFRILQKTVGLAIIRANLMLLWMESGLSEEGRERISEIVDKLAELGGVKDERK